MRPVPSSESLIVDGIEHLIVIVEKIPSIYIVDETVPVVIDTVAGNFAGINPGIGCKILMSQLHAGIRYADDNAVVARCNIPSFWSINISSRFAARWLRSSVEHPPFHGKQGIIRRRFCGKKIIVGLDVLYSGTPSKH